MKRLLWFLVAILLLHIGREVGDEFGWMLLRSALWVTALEVYACQVGPQVWKVKHRSS